MKKIFITFLFFIISINITYAGECLIKDSSSPALLEYIKNNRKVVSEITKQIVSDYKWDKKETIKWNVVNEFSKLQWDIIRIYNEAFDFEWYQSYFKYYAVFPISNEIPYEIKRDYKILEFENKWLRDYLENIVKNNKGNIIIKWICDNINWKCDFKNEIKSSELIWKLIQNNNNILNLFRSTVMWDENTNNDNIVLIGQNFELEISTYYSISSYSECSSDDWFFKQISDKIKNIWILNKEGEDWIQKWRDAWWLLMWKDWEKEKYQKLEKELLKKELSRQWISWDSQTNMLNALDKYNSEWWFSQNNNFIVNSFNNIKKTLDKAFKKIRAEVIWDLFKGEKNEIININDINKAKNNSTTTNSINIRISEMYEQQLKFSWISELNTTNLKSKIINLHLELSDSINTLNKTCEKSVKVCNEQDSGKWNCWKCN